MLHPDLPLQLLLPDRIITITIIVIPFRVGKVNLRLLLLLYRSRLRLWPKHRALLKDKELRVAGRAQPSSFSVVGVQCGCGDVDNLFLSSSLFGLGMGINFF